MKRRLLLLVCLLLLPVGARAALEAAWNPPVVDLRVGLSQTMNRDASLAHGVGQAGYVELRRGGVIGVLLPLPAAEPDSQPKPALSDYLRLRAALESSQSFAIDDCRGRTGRIAVWFELEAPNELAREPSAVPLWVERGVRVFRIAAERDNELATASTGIAPAPATGLTRTGREVVKRILAANAIVDVSGASDASIGDVLELARDSHAPVIATHSNARALADRPWNLSDTAIRGIAQSGGLVAVTALRGSLAEGRPATLEHLLRQIGYLVRIAGAEHVALGTGFESGAGPVRDFRTASDFPRLAVSLRSAGLSAEDVERVFYRNAQRMLCPPRVRK
ncbi:MAG TPA: membrane dipeptidase [Polyangiaceae bacterium]